MSLWMRIVHRLVGRSGPRVLRERLESFRSLLEGNSRVLELMADAGEKLGGEYVFDLHYLDSLISDLVDAVHDVVYHLQTITGGRYPELLDTVWEISAELRAILENRLVVPRAKLVIPLDEVDQDLAEIVGDKMARLGELKGHLACRVPEGFVISAYACQRFLDRAGVYSVPEKDGREIAGELRALISRAPIPRELERAVRRAVRDLGRRVELDGLAVRSSALGEDGRISFAGQYETVLGVEPGAVLEAFRTVVASLYSDNVISYRMQRGLAPTRGLMAVGCLAMIEPASSGVVYTMDPSHPSRDVLVVSATPGLGKAVVEGATPVDTFEVSRRDPHHILQRRIADKDWAWRAGPDGGLRKRPLEPADRAAPAISDGDLQRLAASALTVERYMKRAQDIEWVLDRDGRLYLLQARPLLISADRPSGARGITERVKGTYPVLLRGRGTVACRGIGSGRVHLVGQDVPSEIPRGAVLVARTSTPKLAAGIAEASAVITDVGTATGHLAAIAREFRVPTVVDSGNATEVLVDGQEVTVDAEENVVYGGRVEELLHYQLLKSSSFEEKQEYFLLRRILKRVAPLNLNDPESPEFTASNCTTLHDVIRFAHEEAVEELIRGRWVRATIGDPMVRRLQLEIPIDLVLIDLGDGVSLAEPSRYAAAGDVVSTPLRALLAGLCAEGAWATGPADMDLGGFMASATRSGPLTGGRAPEPQQNLAIVSQRYVHLNLKLGYHFNIVDSHVGDERNDNYAYFRFAGGVTEITRRSRRAVVLRRILESFDFVTEGSGDLVIARIKKFSREDMENRLRMIGRLIGFTRQLDILLRDEGMVERSVDMFMRSLREDVAGSSNGVSGGEA
jgi:pyruvate,water dikinase